MISHKALIHDSDNYHPLGSRRAVANVPNKPEYKHVNMKAVFLSNGNIRFMAQTLHRTHRQNGGRSGIEKFLKSVPVLARQFAKQINLNELESVEYQATGQHNHVDLLKSINSEFQKFCYNHIRWNAFVPTRAWTEVGPTDDRKVKRMSELTAADIPTIDVWQQEEVSVINKAFRNHNKIPFWQTSMHTRHYDRGNDGLNHTPDRASLENFQRGFDMGDIYSGLDKWTEDGWFGMS